MLAAGDQVAVGQQHRIAPAIGHHRGGETAHHIRAVQVIGDLAKTLGLALGAEHAPGLVQTFQRGIVLRLDTGGDGQLELARHRLQGQAGLAHLPGIGGQRLFVQGHALQGQLLTMQHQRR